MITLPYTIITSTRNELMSIFLEFQHLSPTQFYRKKNQKDIELVKISGCNLLFIRVLMNQPCV